VNQRLFNLPVLLSFNGGFVDTAGYLAFKGLFTAHVTGNFVTIAATLISGTSGVVTKMLALPVFCVVVVLTRMVSTRIGQTAPKSLTVLLSTMFILLAAAAAIAIAWGPFPDADAPAAMSIGLTLVVAMAIQNGLHRIYLHTIPPSTLMTGTTTQLMVDIADGLGTLTTQEQAARKTRMQGMIVAVGSFAVGAALAALLIRYTGMWCFAVAPVVLLGARLVARVPLTKA
jgi:uncharacterized membrane protein YoaK (UPF0700 family)